MPVEEPLRIFVSLCVLSGLALLVRMSWPHRQTSLGSAVLLMAVSYGVSECRDVSEALLRAAAVLTARDEIFLLVRPVNLAWPIGEVGVMLFGVSWVYFAYVFSGGREYRPPRRLVRALTGVAAITVALKLAQLAAHLPGIGAELNAPLRLLDGISWGIFVALIFVGLVRLATFYRSVRAHSVRRGTKWLIWCTSIGAGGMLFLIGPAYLGLQPSIGAGALNSTPVLVLIGCLVYVMRRHTSFDVDHFTSRSLVYLILFVTLFVVFAGAMVLLKGLHSGFGEGDHDLLVFYVGVVATLALLPLRSLAQRCVDRLFGSDTYDYRAVLLKLSDELGRSLDVNSVLSAVLDAVIQTVRCRTAWVMLLDEHRQRYTVCASRGVDSVDMAVSIPVGSVRLKNTSAAIEWDDRGEEPAAAITEQCSGDGAAQDSRQSLTLADASLVIPLVKDETILGLLCLGEKHWGDVYVPKDIALLHTIGNQAALAVANAELYSKLERMNEHLQRQVHEQTKELRRANQILRKLHEQAERDASTDALTGLYNRRYMQERLAEEIARARAEGTCLSVVFVDVDELKKVNDVRGHLEGDAVLRNVANAILAETRPTDTPVRFGGDEFVIILPRTPKKGATALSERLERRLNGDSSGESEVSSHHTTVSVGAATFPDDAADEWALIDVADRASYDQKRRTHRRLAQRRGVRPRKPPPVLAVKV